MKAEVKVSELPTYVYIDSSNISFACKRGLGIDLDYRKLYKYLKRKYPKLQKISYFEGKEVEDVEKAKIFKTYTKIGYTMKILERKKYILPPVFRYKKCPNCKQRIKICTTPKSIKLKSNVDVFLCSEIMFDALRKKHPAHFVLLSCDGDYAEMIKKIIENCPKVHITVLATPFTRPENFLSIRLQQLKGELPRFELANIANIRDLICK